MTTAADGYPLLDLMWTFVIFFGLMMYFWALFAVLGDLFRRHDLSGWAKTGWIVLLLVLPIIGLIAYVVSQSGSMADRAARERDLATRQVDDYIRSVAAPEVRGVDEIARGKELLDRGVISREEFEQLKRRALV